MNRRNLKSQALRALWLLLWLCLAAVLWLWAWPMQEERACWLGEWPFDAGCSEHPSGYTQAETAQEYQAHLQRNMGDGLAYAWLVDAWMQEQDPRALDLLPWVQQMAPWNPKLMVVEAKVALQAQDWNRAATTLVHMLERGQGDAKPLLLAMMLDERTQPAVLAQLNAESRWLNPMLSRLDSKIPAAPLQPFMSEGQRLGLLSPSTVLAWVDRLKKQGEWLDAYTLWVALRGKVQAGLFNPGFDQPALRRGFDWEWPTQTGGRQGLKIDQVPASPRAGDMLEVELTGRAALPQPLVGQALLLLANQYKLTGSYKSDRLRTKGGLVWAMRCAHGGDRKAQTPALLDTQREWRTFELTLQVPDECGGAVRLTLETAEPWEARAGMAGVYYFDDFELAPVVKDMQP